MIYHLCILKRITREEKKILLKPILKVCEYGYMFEPKKWEPREKWIKARIRKLERQEKFNLTPAGYWVVISMVLLVIYIVLSLIYWIW